LISIIYLDPPMAFTIVGSAYLVSGFIGYFMSLANKKHKQADSDESN